MSCVSSHESLAIIDDVPRELNFSIIISWMAIGIKDCAPLINAPILAIIPTIARAGPPFFSLAVRFFLSRKPEKRLPVSESEDESVFLSFPE